MKYILYKCNNDGKDFIEFESFDKEEFYQAIKSRIESRDLYYDPCLAYPSTEEQVFMWSKDFMGNDFPYISGFFNHYIKCKNISPLEDRNSYIFEKLEEHYKEALEQGYEIFGILRNRFR